MTAARRPSQQDDDAEEDSPSPRAVIRGGVLVPDPTTLTTLQLTQRIEGLREIIETRLDGMDKAIRLLQDAADKFPARIDEKITSLREIHEEKFRSIQSQFTERDVRTEQTSRDSKVAVDAALQAAKEAVGEQNRSSALAIAKSETAVVKQIDQQGLLIQTNTSGLDGKINDLKERLTRIEGAGLGAAGNRTAAQQLVGIVVAIIGVLLTIGAVVVAITIRMG